MFFFKETAPSEIYPLSLHGALPIFPLVRRLADHAVAVTLGTSMVGGGTLGMATPAGATPARTGLGPPTRSEEHTPELQLRQNFLCCLLLGKKTLSSSIRLSDATPTV